MRKTVNLFILETVTKKKLKVRVCSVSIRCQGMDHETQERGVKTDNQGLNRGTPRQDTPKADQKGRKTHGWVESCISFLLLLHQITTNSVY